MRNYHVEKIFLEEWSIDTCAELLFDYRNRYPKCSNKHIFCVLGVHAKDVYEAWLYMKRINQERDPENRCSIDVIWDKRIPKGSWWLKVDDKVRYIYGVFKRDYTSNKTRMKEGKYKPRYMR